MHEGSRGGRTRTLWLLVKWAVGVLRRMAGGGGSDPSTSFVGHCGRSPCLLLLAAFWMASDATKT